jgi:hypothetical protein
MRLTGAASGRLGRDFSLGVGFGGIARRGVTAAALGATGSPNDPTMRRRSACVGAPSFARTLPRTSPTRDVLRSSSAAIIFRDHVSIASARTSRSSRVNACERVSCAVARRRTSVRCASASLRSTTTHSPARSSFQISAAVVSLTREHQRTAWACIGHRQSYVQQLIFIGYVAGRRELRTMPVTTVRRLLRHLIAARKAR